MAYEVNNVDVDIKELAQKRKEEVDANFEFFETILQDIIKEHKGQFALIKNKEIKGYFATLKDARETAKNIAKDNIYSIQEVTDEVVDLGIFSVCHQDLMEK